MKPKTAVGSATVLALSCAAVPDHGGRMSDKRLYFVLFFRRPKRKLHDRRQDNSWDFAK